MEFLEFLFAGSDLDTSINTVGGKRTCVETEKSAHISEVVRTVEASKAVDGLLRASLKARDADPRVI